jgi:hypothetical protein
VPTRAKIFVALGVLVVLGLAVATTLGLVARAHERELCRKTKARLEIAAKRLSRHCMPYSRNVRDDPTGQASLAHFYLELHVPADDGEIKVTWPDGDELTPKAFDAWGHPLYYCCPGRVHRHGWDLYSAGPNGVDEQGMGDDIVVGFDMTDEP